MSAFASVLVQCPNCDDHIEFRTKVNCVVKTYELYDMPSEIEEALKNKEGKCDSCGQKVRITPDTDLEIL